MSGKAEDAGAENMQSENMRQDDMRAENAGLESGAAAKLTCGVSVAGVTAACGGSNAKPGAENARAESNAGAGEDAESAAGPAARPDSVSGASGRSPRLRVHGFTQPWQTRKLGEMVSVQSGKDYKSLNEGDVPVYGTGGYMLSVSEALSYSEDAIGIGRKGTIDKPFVLRAPFWTVDTLFYCVPKENYDLDFVNVVFQNVNWRVLDESTGVPSLSKKIINEVKAKVPSVGEQRQIGMFFSGLDRIISVQERKTELLRQAKKYFLQNMFPRRGESAPRLRVHGFTQPWQTKKFSDFTYASSVRNKDNLDLVPYAITNEHGFIPQNEAHDEFGYMKNTDRSAYRIVSPDSFGYNPARINIGSIGFYDGCDDVIVSSLYEIFKTDESVDDRFLSYWFKTNDFQNWIARLQEGSVRLYFYYDKLRECKIPVPPSVGEQRQIGMFFSSLDRIISVQERKTEALRQAKKYYLQNMFA